MRFGAFIVTFNRPEILLETIKIILDQTQPPELIWVVDNSSNLATDQVIASLLNPRIKYHHVGYNSGPAGAAAIGLKLCADDGLDWILWADDNDPPFFPDTYEKLLSIRDSNPYCGVLGSVGHFFDRKKGVIKRVQTRLLEKKKSIEVDYVAGGMAMIINSDLVKEGVLPDPGLFFGFEELDFCLKAKRRGYAIVVHTGVFLRLREKHNRLEYDRPFYMKKGNPVREYYSLRNLLFISDSLTLNTMKKHLILKWIAKMVFGFRYGVKYGSSNFKFILIAFYHYWKGVKGKSFPIE
ncbi:glycosyltransferase [Algoriphagus aquimarinus]|uniref:Glycosyltransferase n=1 Tax=Algoriphagus aquimarinus TaxID=237018 RepID=A0A5C7A8E1_9BACT|nr:glycosyltransferase [Algoriphagus aquimarinus]TXE02404.1 glycosyltransferase [Algoriphagus aquimarinus]